MHLAAAIDLDLHREIDLRMSLDAIERGRAALAEPLPAPRCDQPRTRFQRFLRLSHIVVAHFEREGRWS